MARVKLLVVAAHVGCHLLVNVVFRFLLLPPVRDLLFGGGRSLRESANERLRLVGLVGGMIKLVRRKGPADAADAVFDHHVICPPLIDSLEFGSSRRGQHRADDQDRRYAVLLAQVDVMRMVDGDLHAERLILQLRRQTFPFMEIAQDRRGLFRFFDADIHPDDAVIGKRRRYGNGKPVIFRQLFAEIRRGKKDLFVPVVPRRLFRIPGVAMGKDEREKGE